ncbi:cobalamin-5'-phosphate synthase [Streptoalloteichus tenebrarius]|uniref:Adenosylcobinamide-GDP ribazoletransferase n=1 Tax=Streptoalloteichus tenebrarius (strain ATCC 17920 / DSM 40477 / JCM 4838 / CBS 697.72 / NBRC 16177 / NCIMB 11028 / NRRL B-12390 / A12253. 1 / ISP 5477) TaxID=1933 RepID=A0ABT1HX33_STRSD|nr:adenosylcobinamide-GDP ribazoletransferase [Streptoalloteichus tenebrarius]MCP2260077.1 cobalamin-5'-phosphate synthase [Streptoalloteichus tenebrarius]BFF00604.1 adenosylcobinamide-GDP ribazoletransferase [Streptoalloteichus tenebrarius]
MHGLRLALTWLTVLPVPAGRFDRDVCRRAIALAPLVGALVGGLGAAALAGARAAGAPGLVSGFAVLGLLVLLTRGMHVDGLADVVDGLGCYGPPERALAVMKDGGAGPFAVVALVLVLGAQASALAALAEDGRWAAVVLAVAAGRAAFAWCCRRGVPAARPEGMGALVAGSQPTLVPVAWWLVLAALGTAAVPERPWQGPLAVLAAAGLVTLLTWHATRRFGGITGDVLGAGCEVATTAVLVTTCLG